MNFNNLNPIRLYCPNCGKILTAYVGEDNIARIKCSKCYVVLTSKMHGVREMNIKMKSTV